MKTWFEKNYNEYIACEILWDVSFFFGGGVFLMQYLKENS